MANICSGSLSIYLLISISALINECNSGFCVRRTDCKWFGDRSQYPCRCDYLGHQCVYPITKCQCLDGWFGPGCSYRRANITGAPLCAQGSNNPGTSDLEVTLERPQKLTWLRLTVVSDTVKTILESFNFEYKTENGAVQQANVGSKMTVDNKTVDYSIRITVLVKKLIIKGGGVGSLCSVDISNGRNVAVGETNINHSKVYYHWPALNALDGGYTYHNDTRKEHAMTCTHLNHDIVAGEHQDPPFFVLNFSIPAQISTVTIHNRKEITHQKNKSYAVRLNGFTLLLFDKDFNVVFNYTDNHTTETVNVYNVYFDIDAPIHGLKLSLPKNEDVLHFCELQAFGEKSCTEKNKFGFNCELKCHCLNGDPCFIPSGLCPGDCEPGWREKSCHLACNTGTYGENCALQCSDHCVDSRCNSANGVCSHGCIKGWAGDYCEKRVCQSGTYGKNCASTCSTGCINKKCNNVTGFCTLGCVDGWTGDLCNTKVCKSGMYGTDCLSKCSANCANSTCDKDSGRCTFGCKIGWIGDLCNTKWCEPGMYGVDCLLECSHCINSTCDHINGSCAYGCIKGWTGDLCNITEDKSDDNVRVVKWAILVASLFFLLLITLLFFLKRKFDEKLEPVTEGEDGGYLVEAEQEEELPEDEEQEDEEDDEEESDEDDEE